MLAPEVEAMRPMQMPARFAHGFLTWEREVACSESFAAEIGFIPQLVLELRGSEPRFDSGDVFGGRRRRSICANCAVGARGGPGTVEVGSVGTSDQLFA